MIYTIKGYQHQLTLDYKESIFLSTYETPYTNTNRIRHRHGQADTSNLKIIGQGDTTIYTHIYIYIYIYIKIY